MNRKSKIIVSVVGIAIVLLALLGITYAYYLTRIEGNTNTNSISVTTADLKLKYDDGTSKLVTKEDIMPGTVIEKDFKVTNEGQSKVNGYVVVLEDIDNTLTRHSDLVYKVECKLNDATSCGFTEEVIYPYDRKLAVIFTNDIDVGVTHNYTLTVTYKNLEDIDQSDDMGKMFDGRVNIMDANNINPYTLTDTTKNETSLAYNIINNAMTNANGTTFRTTPLTIPAKESTSGDYLEKGIDPTTYSSITPSTSSYRQYYVYGDDYKITPEGKFVLMNPQIFKYEGDITPLKGKYIDFYYGDSESTAIRESAEGYEYYELYKVGEETTAIELYYGIVSPQQESLESTLSVTPDNLGMSYYFRGDVKDNYVLFNNICFRIVRIEGDGSVKLLYAGNASDGAINCNEVGESIGFIDSDNVYYHDDSHNIEGVGVYVNASIEEWFDAKFENNKKDKIKNDKWCSGSNNDFVYRQDGYRFEGSMNDYDGLWDIIIEDEISDGDSYYQSAIRYFEKRTSLLCENETYSISKFGLITADEAILSGVGTSDDNINYYLVKNKYYVDDDGYYSDVRFYTMTRFHHYWGYNADTVQVVSAGLVREYAGSDCEYSNLISPSITLIPGITISSGVGTKTNPYIIN